MLVSLTTNCPLVHVGCRIQEPVARIKSQSIIGCILNSIVYYLIIAPELAELTSFWYLAK